MVSGKPYISVNSATMNAEKAPKERQSREVFGLEKLNAKMMNISEFRTTRDHKPYAGASFMIAPLGSGLAHWHRRHPARAVDAGRDRAPRGERCASADRPG